MANDNRISAELSAAALTAIRDAVAVIRTNLPFLIRGHFKTGLCLKTSPTRKRGLGIR